MERATTTASSLVAEQGSGNSNRTQSMATLNESFLQETGSGSGPRCQDTILRVQKLKLVICPIAVKVNPTLFYYMYCNSLEYAKVKTVNGECQIQAPSRTRKGTGKNGKTWVKIQLLLLIPIPHLLFLNHHQKKKSRRKQRKDSAPTEPTTEETPDEAHISTPSYDPPQSGEDSMQLSELMNLCTSLQEKSRKNDGAEKDVVLMIQLLLCITTSTGQSKGILVALEVPLKKKDQIAMDEEVARNLEAQLQAELEEEERISRLKEEKANIALLESWDNTQAMMDADFQLAQQMQTKEQEQLSIEEKSKLFVELLEKRNKHFAALRAQEKRSKPPTKAQKRNTMSTYLKNMAGYKHNQLKSKSYDEIQEMFDKEMKRVNTFVDMNTELVKGSKTKAEGSSKRAGDELEQEKAKKEKGDDDQEEAEMKRHIEIVKDDEVAIDAIPLATKPPVIVEYQIDKDGRIDKG
ncbi:hypothetical protein Tco_0392679 [Tanacetum coccineum]